MSTSQKHIDAMTPMGANLIPGKHGATFRVWAPGAVKVFVSGSFNSFSHGDADLLVKDEHGYWAGFVPGVKDGDTYKFYVVGQGSEGFKRDPYARDLSTVPAYPTSNCIVRDPTAYPWHDQNWRAPELSDLVIYQFHVGTFFGPSRESRVAKFLDVLDRIDYLVALGVNALEPLPITEYSSPRSLGYDGSDLYSPEMEYSVDRPDLIAYLAKVNALFARKGIPPISQAQLAVPIHQLKALIDICHAYGLAVILDVVYNHAGSSIAGQDESLWFFDREKPGNKNDSLYFTDQDNAGPVFAFWKQEVRQFLIDNAIFFVREYHADGFRYDETSVIVRSSSDGWGLCQNLTSSVRAANNRDFQVAEYWPVDPYVARDQSQGGAGFDATWHDGLRESIRNAVGQATGGRDAHLNLDAIAANLYPPGYPAWWKAVAYVESHDEVYDQPGRAPRMPAVADPSNHWSWYARSRSRVALGLILTAPSIPMLFMGQEFFEDKQWSDNPPFFPNTLIWWDGLQSGQKPMVDFLRFTQELIALRRRLPGLRGGGLNVFHVHNDNRVLAFQRWAEGIGRDVVVVVSLNESTYYGYQIGFPGGGRWLEVFNSDVYDNWVNPITAGNGGGISADGPPMHGLPSSAGVVIPANGLVVFARDNG
jgi:1,4-alpha-glucan branching enzyme